ncbi:hypothetical protein A2U01_0068871, partial [Trifolium medium]|nr:hypothetical protein [Trifolium medium]
QPSVGERSVVIPSPSYNAGHKESQPSPTHNRNTGAAEGCEVEPDPADAANDAADVVEKVKVVPVMLPLPVLSLNLAMLFERIIVQVAP